MENWINEIVKCDLCSYEWNALYETSCDRLECPNCQNMAHFEVVERKCWLEKQLKMKESSVIRVPIKEHFAGDYRIEYDGKYVSLFGKDCRYEAFRYSDEQDLSYEEMLLIPIVTEVRNADPKIKEVTDSEIVIEL